MNRLFKHHVAGKFNLLFFFFKYLKEIYFDEAKD